VWHGACRYLHGLNRIGLILLFLGIIPAVAPGQDAIHRKWADSLLRTMTLRQMVAQSMMPAAWSNKDVNHIKQIEDLIYREQVGGIIFFQGSAMKQLKLTNYYQQCSRIPLLIGIDGEWGLAMRLNDAERYPYAMTLGAGASEDLAFQTGAAMGRECRRIGVHINFAPVVDLNTNPKNPIIGFRSFGDDRFTVSRMSNAFIKGMQSEQVMACAKHFPGHGDTDADSHLDLPVLSHPRGRLDSIELYPFRQAFAAGVDACMVAHLQIPALDSTRNLPSSLSRPIVTGLLRKQMQFEGLIITDALNMKGVSKFFPPGKAELHAYLAGADILLFPENPKLGLDLICAAVDSGRLDSLEVAERARRVLMHKSKYGLQHYRHANPAKLHEDLNRNNDGLYLETASMYAAALASNRKKLVPLYANNKQKVAVITVGKAGGYNFRNELARYQRNDHFPTDRNAGYRELELLRQTVSRYDIVILSLHDAGLWGKKASTLPQALFQFIAQLNEKGNLILVNFGNVYQFSEFSKLETAIAAWEDHPAFHRHTASAIYGIHAFSGRLPAQVSASLNRGQGQNTASLLYPALPVACPEDALPDTTMVSRIDQTLNRLTRSGAAPGGQLLVLQYGRIIFERNFGHADYRNKRPVQVEDLYDLASITKTAATTLVAMKLYEMGKIRLSDKVEQYLPEFLGNEKAGITIEQLLTHEAGLEAWIPFYKELIQTPEYLLDSTHAGCGCFPIAANLHLDSAYLRVIWDRILKSPVGPRGQYKYSDLSMIILQRILELAGGASLDELAERYFYRPMELQKIAFRPLERFDPYMIAPTTNDKIFRIQTLRGYVHDPAAAMLGGVAGHAGLFSNASDLAAVYQMLLDGGFYNGRRLLKPETIQTFTARHSNRSRRGLGFDKPETNPRLPSPTSTYCSPETFGHTGFTGTCVWADPKKQLVFVFLSNRVHPDEENQALIKGNYRTELQRLIYESLR
jgi:beta-N-acetylhexosaminidase